MSWALRRTGHIVAMKIVWKRKKNEFLRIIILLEHSTREKIDWYWQTTNEKRRTAIKIYLSLIFTPIDGTMRSAHAPWNAERSVRIVVLKSLRSRRARPKTTGKFYFQIKISFAQKRFVRCGVWQWSFWLFRRSWTVAWAMCPIKNNIHRIGSTIVNQRTISEMKIKIYCLCCVVPAAAHHSAPRMCLRFYILLLLSLLWLQYWFYTKLRTKKTKFDA